MGTDTAEVDEQSHYACTVKVHHAMCMQLRALVDRVLTIFPCIEAARPRCTAGIEALCLLRSSIAKAKQLLQNCSESSRFYLAITGDATVSRFERTRKQLAKSLTELQSMVPMNLEMEISQIVDDIRCTVFNLEPSDQEAGKVIRALLQKDEDILSLFGNSELHAIQFAASRLHLASQKDLLIEKRSIKKMLDKVGDIDHSKRLILKYLHYLMSKHDKQVLKWQPHDGSFSFGISEEKSISKQHVDIESRLRHKMDDALRDKLHSTAPEEFKCPLSMKLMIDPVVIASGQTYERVFIESWFDDNHDTCPATGMKLPNFSLTPNTEIRNLISRWCKEQGIDLYESTPNSSPFNPLESYSSISSADSLGSLHLQMDLSNVSLESVDSNSNSDNFFPSSSSELKFFSSIHEMETDLLSNISQLPWESQHMAIEDAQSYLDTHRNVPLPSKKFMEPVVGYLKEAIARQDTRAQIAGSRLFLTGLRTSRTALRCMNEDMYDFLSSLLGSAITNEVLTIFELAVERGCGTKLVQSTALSSIIELLDPQHKQLHEPAIKVLHSLSTSNNPCLWTFLPLDLVTKMVPLLKDTSLSRHSIAVLEKLMHSEKAQTLAIKADGCISAIVELLETGGCEEQEHALSILLCLCSRYEECCVLVMKEGIIASLFGIAVNGTEIGKAVASELLRLLRDVAHEEDEEEEDSVSGDGGDVSVNRTEDKETVPRKRNGLFSKIKTKLKNR